MATSPEPYSDEATTDSFNPDHVALLRRGVDAVNESADERGDTLNLRGADLEGVCLHSEVGVNLARADLSYAFLARADLRGANLRGANLTGSLGRLKMVGWGKR